MPGFNSFIGQDTDHEVTLAIWTNLTLSPGGRTTAQALLPTVLNQVYADLSLPTGVDQSVSFGYPGGSAPLPRATCRAPRVAWIRW